MNMNLESLNHELVNEFADCLNAEESGCPTYHESMEYFKRIENALLDKSQYDISDVQLSGSLRKGTALNYCFDVDIIVFYYCKGGYQNYLNIREDLLEEIEEIIDDEFMNENLSDKKSFARSFQFNVNGIHFDILTGLNRLQGNECQYSTFIDIQYNRIINIIHYKSGGDSPTKASHEMQTSMSEKSDQFVLDQSGFVRNLIMLCKDWCWRYLSDHVNFYGRSSTIELIAIYVGNCCESDGDLNYSRAFYMFLDEWARCKSMKIEFHHSPKFKKHLITHESPYILDPINPYNNRLHHVGQNKLYTISKIAKKSLNQFRKCFDNPDRFDNFFDFRTRMGYAYEDYDIFE